MAPANPRQPAMEVEVMGNSWINIKTLAHNNHQRQNQVMLRDSQTGLYSEQCFNEFLTIEKKRCERSEGQELLMLANLSSFNDITERQNIAKSAMDILSDITRDTDIKGWHVEGLVIGILFTEIGNEETIAFTLRRISNKCLRRLQSQLGEEILSRIQINWLSLQSGRIHEFDNISMGSL
jgi:hypothetical protein